MRGVWLWSSVTAAGGPFQGLAVPRAWLGGLVHCRWLRGGLGRGRVFHSSTVRGQPRALQVPGWEVPTVETAGFHPDACVSTTREKSGVTQAPVSTEPQAPSCPTPQWLTCNAGSCSPGCFWEPQAWTTACPEACRPCALTSPLPPRRGSYPLPQPC